MGSKWINGRLSALNYNVGPREQQVAFCMHSSLTRTSFDAGKLALVALMVLNEFAALVLFPVTLNATRSPLL